MTNKNQLNLSELLEIINQRVSEKDESSYSYKIVKEGLEKAARKVGEEAVEVVIASFVNEKKRDQKSRDELVGELCDLFYHTLLLMKTQDVKLEEIYETFKKRNDKHR